MEHHRGTLRIKVDRLGILVNESSMPFLFKRKGYFFQILKTIGEKTMEKKLVYKGKTKDVLFSEIREDIIDLENTVATFPQSISALQGQIDTKVDKEVGKELNLIISKI